VAPGEALAAILGALHEERADRPRREARSVYGNGGLAVSCSHQSSDDGTQDLLQHCFIEPTEKPVDRGLVGDVPQSQYRTQFSMFGQTDFGFAEGPILITHQAQDREQLGLLEAMFRKFAAVGWQDGLAHVQRDGGKFH
jgi:hypothetical protein